MQGAINTLAYEPVTLQGKHFLTLYIIAPHNLASNVAFTLSQQKDLSTIIIIVIGLVSASGAFLVLTWNRRLENTVNTRTEDLRRANEQLKHRGKMQKEFIDVAAHELSTRIQLILGIAEVLKSRIMDKEQSESLDVLIRNAKRLQRLSKDILDVTMIESRMLKLNKEKRDLNELIANTVKEQIEQLQRFNSRVKLLFEQQVEGQDGEKKRGNRIFVDADREKVDTQVVCNLISNAIKFTRDGIISIGTTVKEKEDGKLGSDVIVRVKDTGQGIAPERNEDSFQSSLLGPFNVPN